MYTRLYLTITTEEKRALESLAILEMRPLKEQARFLIHEGLLSWGALPEDEAANRPPVTTQS